MSPIAIYHEHPDWFKPLFEELNTRGIPFVRLNPAAHQFAIEAPALTFAFLQPHEPVGLSAGWDTGHLLYA